MEPLDFNLLAALEVLLEEQSVARAADRLGLSPSAMSRTLTRLRTTMKDPVLVRAGRGLVPSPRAQESLGQVGRLAGELRGLLSPAAPWNPLTASRTLNLRFSDGLVEALGPALLAEVSSQAPGLRLRFLNKTDRSHAGLREGWVDLETGVVGQPSSPEVIAAPLFEDEFVVAVRATHPWGAKPPTLDDYLGAAHVAALRPGREGERVDFSLAAAGRARDVRVQVSGFASALALAAQTDLVATVPERHTRSLRSGLTTLPLPWPVAPISVSLLWHPRSEADQAHQWLRSTLKRLAAQRL